MARVFLDNNYFIDVVHRRPEIQALHQLQNHTIFISVISVPNFYYIYKIKVPNENSVAILGKFNYVDFSHGILEKALEGPFTDIEDNIQLHSAAEAECDCFLTGDRQLLGLKFFGKMKIMDSLV